VIVYVVMWDPNYGPRQLHGVYKDQDDAQQAVDKLQDDGRDAFAVGELVKDYSGHRPFWRTNV
jgi:hypothetical protein